ncbi:ester cyclase [Streptomyces sp. NBC_01005]|uniref:ester cyclase n=1 Tax=unclassified Streptomyces TaxID=2593676 RepID=UPI00386CD02C|nr:ester cyclase [Streptomyces sp. NBC_01005]WTC93391.1 ester cyclase [Streptomyces sp. NBC_01650]
MFIDDFARAAEAAVNHHSIDEVTALWREPARYDSPLTGPQEGIDALAARESALFAGFSDLRASIRPLGQDGLTGSMLVRFEGTHDGEYGAFAATGNSIVIEMAAVITFDSEGYVVEERLFADSATVVGQLTHHSTSHD